MISPTRLSRDDVERLYVELAPALLAYGCCLLGDRARAQDAVHQVFLRLLQPGGCSVHEARPYLYRALRNAALNLERGASREHARWAAAVLFAPPPGLETVGLDLETALRDLSDEQRQVVLMKVWGGLTFQEIAQVMDLPANTAASRYRYGLERLRERLAPHLTE